MHNTPRSGPELNHSCEFRLTLCLHHKIISYNHSKCTKYAETTVTWKVSLGLPMQSHIWGHILAARRLSILSYPQHLFTVFWRELGALRLVNSRHLLPTAQLSLQLRKKLERSWLAGYPPFGFPRLERMMVLLDAFRKELLTKKFLQPCDLWVQLCQRRGWTKTVVTDSHLTLKINIVYRH